MRWTIVRLLNFGCINESKLMNWVCDKLKWKFQIKIQLKNWKITPSAGDSRVPWYNQDKTRTLSSMHWSRTARCQDWELLWSYRRTKTSSSARRAIFTPWESVRINIWMTLFDPWKAFLQPDNLLNWRHFRICILLNPSKFWVDLIGVIIR